MINLKRSVVTNNILIRTNSIFSIIPILPQLLFISIALGIYFYLTTIKLFYYLLSHIFLGVKIFVAWQMIIGSARSVIMPVLALTAGLLILFTIQNYHITLVQINDAYQLILMALVGLVITLLTRW